jgi:hypothetical protein
MSGSGRKVVMALLGSVILAGLMMPGSASAATGPVVRIKVCNDSGWRQYFALSGRDERGKWRDQGVYWSIFDGDCKTFGGYWWETGQHLQVHYGRTSDSNGNLRTHTMTSFIKKDFPDGSTVRLHVSRVGP